MNGSKVLDPQNFESDKIVPDLLEDSPPRMKEPLVEEDHDEVDEGGGDDEDRHHPGEGEEQADG